MRLYHLLKTNFHITKQELNTFIKTHNVLINNHKANLSDIIYDNDIVTVDNKIIENIPKVIYLYYKPIGITSVISNKDDSYIKHINIKERVFPAGRLDKMSEGLLVLTNDHKLLNDITNDKTIYDKEYIVKVKNIITDKFIIDMQKSHLLDNKYTKEAKVKKIDNYTFSIILYEGMYHQIRRMVKMNNNYVINLKRIRIGNFKLDGLNPKDIKKMD